MKGGNKVVNNIIKKNEVNVFGVPDKVSLLSRLSRDSESKKSVSDR